VTALSSFIYKGFRGWCPEMPYPRGVPVGSLKASRPVRGYRSDTWERGLIGVWGEGKLKGCPERLYPQGFQRGHPGNALSTRGSGGGIPHRRGAMRAPALPPGYKQIKNASFR